MAAGALLTVCVLSATALRTGFGLHTVSAIYGETIDISCGHGQEKPDGLLFGKWKYEQPDGNAVFVATRSAVKNRTSFDDVPEYNGRLDLSENYTLSISNARITDEKRFVCMLITEENVFEVPSLVKVFILSFIHLWSFVQVGDCISKDSYPDTNITWYRNGHVLFPVDGESSKERNSTSGLHNIRSSLQYMSSKNDIDAQFSCAVAYYMPNGMAVMESDPVVFDIYYPTEKVTIHVQSPKKTIKEGDDITLKCIGNGNPPPQEFLFYLPGQEEGIRSSSAYHITDIKRNATGDYKCSLLNKVMIASTMVTVHYLDLSLTPSGDITKQIGDSLSVSCIPSASKNVSVTWMKPRIKLSKKTNTDGKSKTIFYEVDGFPKPEVQCVSLGNGVYLNKTEETTLSNGRYAAKIIISPEENVTIICSAENKLGKESHSLNISASESNDHAKLIVGIVVGLLLAALVAGLAYWIYIKRSSSASKHVGKELGNTEENKKLEENNHKSEA
ncbi:hypothetical protein GDO78_000731 [Eleutherodactylus coqui]|uniref:Ig-like domain-containing protein n=1 Tax=Eleutherodactylus coqui TaxID=57060 RepID=A0A8J6FQ19_ELECQ|nr:hypothetical protein GDO78_000731 [Eleutherodactylus coqui]KAG9492383.1 hypothetical protein GDO78_000731 [Eleutherodactylus coqui]